MAMKNISADIVIFGGSLGGTLAAYSAAKSGKKTILFEETDWIGGQLTTQAVPPDEHRWIEETGCTASYRAYRNKLGQAVSAAKNIYALEAIYHEHSENRGR
jgi:NADPH-dependent 2,4-dienoyl-CoA reductase/sulfur reductase-like enzyme